jgi:hypothetical protein
MPADLGGSGLHGCLEGGRGTQDVNELLTNSHIIFI